MRAALLPLLLHVLLCLGLFQYGLSDAEMDRLRIDGPSRLIDPYVKALRIYGPLGVLRTYLRGEQDEKLYLEYSRLLLTGRVDMAYVADRQNDKTLSLELPARAWPYRDVRVEYPPLAFLATVPPALLSLDYRPYRYLFSGYMLALHLLNLWLSALLLRPQLTAASRSQGSSTARLLYISLAFLFALGSVVMTRMDHLVTTSSLLALLAFARAQRSSGSARLGWAAACGALAALGVMVKLVPGLAGLAAAVLWWRSGARDRLRCIAASASAGLCVLALSNAAMYWLAGERYLDTFRYHGLRGVQLESVYAGVIMLLHPFGVPMQVEESFGSTNLASSATSLVKQLSPVLFLLACGSLSLLRRFSADGRGALCLTLLLLLSFMLTNRVFSPQYLIWIGAPLCVLAAEAPRPARGFALFLGAVLLSQLIFPRGYPVLKALHPLGILLLNLRNFSLIAFGLWLTGRTSTGLDGRSRGA
jgi:hypothetical protein